MAETEDGCFHGATGLPVDVHRGRLTVYEDFFGFKERPFSLVPNPAYLFLSKGHEEVLAHLRYALVQGDGFVEILGEVGTGKTTLCRAFLDELDESTEAAFIFNPKLNAIELLQAVHDEFGIDHRPDGSTKELVDSLNAFLMARKEEGKQVVLLIDEAQNLSPEVLEQLRLLSNLETKTSKLLQIILVGQPELGQMLDSPQLRQLAQRITLRWHLAPLDYKETQDYIIHRVRVASQSPKISFDRAALHLIHRFSHGVPRNINILCERALLTAFTLNTRHVSSRIVKRATRELSGRSMEKGLRGTRKGLAILGVFVVTAFLILFHQPRTLQINGFLPRKQGTTKPYFSTNAQRQKATLTSVQIRRPAPPGPKAKPVKSKNFEVKNIEDLLLGLDSSSSRRAAFLDVMKQWGIESPLNPSLDSIKNDASFFRLAGSRNGFLVQRVEGGVKLLKKLDLPAILEMESPKDHTSIYLTLIGTAGSDKIILKGGKIKDPRVVSLRQLRSHWPGIAYVPWKNFLAFDGLIPVNAPKDSILVLKMLLRELGFRDVVWDPSYDNHTREAVRIVQRRHGIEPDGVVGPLTKIVLYNEIGGRRIPHLSPLPGSKTLTETEPVPGSGMPRKERSRN